MTADETDTGDAPELMFFLERLGNITKYIERDLRDQFGLSLGEYEILAALSRSPRAQAELYQQTSCLVAAVSRRLVRLVREGWVVRRHPAHDRREYVVNITQRGRNQLRRVRQRLTEILRPMAEELTLEDERLLAQVEQNLTRLVELAPVLVRLPDD